MLKVFEIGQHRGTQITLFGANRHQQNWPPLRRIRKIDLHSVKLEIWLNSDDMVVAETRLIQQTSNQTNLTCCDIQGCYLALPMVGILDKMPPKCPPC